MNNKMCLTMAAAWALLAGCTTQQEAPHHPQASRAVVLESKALLYVYRDHGEPAAGKATIFVDGWEIVGLSPHGFSWIYLAPGRHTVSSRWPESSGKPPVEFVAEFEAGARYFLEVPGKPGPAGSSAAPPADPLNAPVLARMQSAEAQRTVARLEKCCRYLRPHVAGL